MVTGVAIGSNTKGHVVNCMPAVRVPQVAFMDTRQPAVADERERKGTAMIPLNVTPLIMLATTILAGQCVCHVLT